jgi:hypothetical protein
MKTQTEIQADKQRKWEYWMIPSTILFTVLLALCSFGHIAENVLIAGDKQFEWVLWLFLASSINVFVCMVVGVKINGINNI